MKVAPDEPDRRLRGLIVDFAGVLTSPIHDALCLFAESENVEPAGIMSVLSSAYAEGPEAGEVAALETGELTLEEFERSLAAQLRTRSGEPLRPNGLVKRMFARLSPDETMAAAVRRLHDRGIRTALLSNTWGVEQKMREEILELFDATVLSGEVGLRKPDPKIYLLAVERLGLQPHECAFIDDFEVNVRSAQRVGLHGILHVRPEETIRRVEDLFALPLHSAR